MTNQCAPQAGEPDLVEERLAQLEQFTNDVSHAIDSLVTSILDIQKANSIQAPLVSLADHQEALLEKLQAAEHQIAQDRIARDLGATSRAHPKKPTVVFIGRIRFVDNIKYTWLAFQNVARELGIDAWYLPLGSDVEHLVKENGGQCFPADQSTWTGQHVSTLLSAAVVVSDDHLMSIGAGISALLAGAKHIQLWHGIGIKDVGYANIPPLKQISMHTARLLSTCGPFSTFVSTAQKLEPEWRRSFSFSNYSVCGYARNDIFYRAPTPNDLLNVDTDTMTRMRETIQRGRRVFFYAPTFRDGRLASWIAEIDLPYISNTLSKAGDLLVVNLHPLEQPWQKKIASAWPEISFIKEGSDIYPLLKYSSALITDYSSLLFDYLHLDRPIIQFKPDHELYITQSRKLHDDKETDKIGHNVFDERALIRLLEKASLETEQHCSKRKELFQRFYEVRDGSSASQICQLIADEVMQATATH